MHSLVREQHSYDVMDINLDGIVQWKMSYVPVMAIQPVRVSSVEQITRYVGFLVPTVNKYYGSNVTFLVPHILPISSFVFNRWKNCNFW